MIKILRCNNKTACEIPIIETESSFRSIFDLILKSWHPCKAPWYIHTHIQADPHVCTRLCIDMLICTQSTFHFCEQPKVRMANTNSAAGEKYPKSPSSSPPFHFPPSFTRHPQHSQPPTPHFCLSGKPRFISLVKILDCQSDQLPVSRALHGSSNYNPVQLARAHVAVGQPL